MSNLQIRHIQNFSEAQILEPHWGYANRALPCTNDPGSCRYLDIVYHSHDLGILYTGILWASILGLLLIWWTARCVGPSDQRGVQLDELQAEPRALYSTFARLRTSLVARVRCYLLPEFAASVFGRTTRLQVLVLAILTGYLAVFTFVGVEYGRWITPVKKMPGVYNTRTSLGPWSNRVGTLAFALTSLSVLLASRESLLSLLTGLPYQSFNFLHRWLGYIIIAQSSLHTIGWSIIELSLYQPQPDVGRHWIVQQYMIWGVLAMFSLFALCILSTPWGIRLVGYEAFRKSHYLLAILYIGTCIGHWKQLQCYMIPSLVVWLVDRMARHIRTVLLHYNYLPHGGMAFKSVQGQITNFPDAVNGDVVRVSFDHPQSPWKIGQHFYLCFPGLSIWQSHPFTPLNNPVIKSGKVTHSYILRAKKGETKRVAQLASSRTGDIPSSHDLPVQPITTSVILSGPYGVSEVSHLTGDTNILCVAGGTGITYVLPVLLSQLESSIQQSPSSRSIELVWAVRKQSDSSWIQPELDTLFEASKSINLTIRLFVTRENQETEKPTPVFDAKATERKPSLCSSDQKATVITNIHSLPLSSDNSLNWPTSRHFQRPDLETLVRVFTANTVAGTTSIFASGPGGMISDLRRVVASCNDGAKVWGAIGEET